MRRILPVLPSTPPQYIVMSVEITGGLGDRNTPFLRNGIAIREQVLTISHFFAIQLAKNQADHPVFGSVFGGVPVQVAIPVTRAII